MAKLRKTTFLVLKSYFTTMLMDFNGFATVSRLSALNLIKGRQSPYKNSSLLSEKKSRLCAAFYVTLFRSEKTMILLTEHL